ncbi:MAG: hypothetical protein HW377_1629, partial [Actinobacteria bacterium]|nr:hypothetical protein [Actinomycetota bacterium]
MRAVYEKSGKDFVLHIGDTQVKYSHNADGKLVKTSVANGPAVSFSFDAAGNMEALNYSNGVRTTYAYDKSGRTISIAHQKENRVLTGRNYDWSPSGQVSGIEYLPTGTRSTLLYDSDSRLVSMEGPGKISVSYLQGGLRNSVKEGGAEIAPYRYDESWRLAEAGKVRYSHDAAG